MKTTKWVAACATVLVLSACGGGGDGSDDDSGGEEPEATYNVAAAYTNMLTDGGHWDLEGEFQDTSFTMTLDYAAGGADEFPFTGEPGSTFTQHVVVEGPGGTQVADNTVYYDPATVRLIGSASDDECSVITKQNALPSNAKVGDDGVFWESTNYAGCSDGSAVDSTSVTEWQLRSINGTVYFCMKQVDSTEDVSTECYSIDTAGRLGTKARITIETDGDTIEASN